MKAREAGYLTVEAALLFYFVMMAIVCMIFLSFYSYDRCMLEQCAYAAALRGSSNRFTSTEEAYKEASQAAESLVAEKLFAVKELKTTVSVSAVMVTVSYDCVVNMPIGNTFVEEIADQAISMTVTKKVPRNRTVAVLRQLQ